MDVVDVVVVVLVDGLGSSTTAPAAAVAVDIDCCNIIVGSSATSGETNWSGLELSSSLVRCNRRGCNIVAAVGEHVVNGNWGGSVVLVVASIMEVSISSSSVWWRFTIVVGEETKVG